MDLSEVIIRENISQPVGRKFPTEGTNLYKILHDPQHRQKFHTQLKRYNPLVVGFYIIGLLPLFGASRTVMLLTTRGCKSGKIRRALEQFLRESPAAAKSLFGWEPGADKIETSDFSEVYERVLMVRFTEKAG